MNESELFRGTKSFGQMGVQALVHFDRGKLIDGRQQMFRERAKAGADLQCLIGRVQIGSLGDAVQDILVVQQILTECFGKAYGFLIQGAANLIAVHDITFCSVARVRSSCFSVIVSGGEKAITWPCSPAGRRM